VRSTFDLVNAAYAECLRAAAGPEAEVGRLLAQQVVSPGELAQEVFGWLHEEEVVDAPYLFRREGGPYQGADGEEWPDNLQRFALLGWVAAHLAGDDSVQEILGDRGVTVTRD
jgi:hypothetical protein